MCTQGWMKESIRVRVRNVAAVDARHGLLQELPRQAVCVWAHANAITSFARRLGRHGIYISNSAVGLTLVASILTSQLSLVA